MPPPQQLVCPTPPRTFCSWSTFSTIVQTSPPIQEHFSHLGDVFHYFQNILEPVSEYRLSADNMGFANTGARIRGLPCGTLARLLLPSHPRFSHLWNGESRCAALIKYQKDYLKRHVWHSAMPVIMSLLCYWAHTVSLPIWAHMGNALFGKSEERKLL